MINRTHPPQNLKRSKWFHLIFSITLAFILALTLLLIPITAGAVIRVPALIPSLNDSMTFSLPFGAKLVYATGGLTITKLAPSIVNQGGILTYTLLVTNNTGQNLTSGIITDTTPLNTAC